MTDSLVQALLADPNFISFVVSYGASVAWDATKLAAGFLKPKGDEGGLETGFAALAADDQLTRQAGHLINEIAQSSGLDPIKFASGDVAILVSTISKFLNDASDRGAPLLGSGVGRRAGEWPGAAEDLSYISHAMQLANTVTLAAGSTAVLVQSGHGKTEE